MENNSTNLEELSFNELKKLCKEKNIETSRGDNKEILLEKLREYARSMATRAGGLKSIQNKMSKKKKVIITKNDPEDTRDSVLISITNATGTYSYVVPFNKEIELPEPIIKNIKNRTVQKFKKVNKGFLGNVDVAYEDRRYIVQEVI